MDALNLNYVCCRLRLLEGGLDVEELFRLPVQVNDDEELGLVGLDLVYVLPVVRHPNDI